VTSSALLTAYAMMDCAYTHRHSARQGRAPLSWRPPPTQSRERAPVKLAPSANAVAGEDRMDFVAVVDQGDRPAAQRGA